MHLYRQGRGWQHHIGVFVIMIFTTLVARAESLRLPAIFGDHMVLQQGVKAPVWGWTTPGQEVTVSFSDQHASGKADAGGRWRVELPVPKADGEAHELLITAGNARQCFTDVLAGEVWLCSGQSNAKFAVSATAGGKAAAAAAKIPTIRLFQVDMWCAPQPLDDVHGHWMVCNPEVIGAFSAVGYFFARDLNRALAVPVGIIDSTSGGTAAEAWISQSCLEADPQLTALVKPDSEFYRTVEQYAKDRADYMLAQATKRQPLPPYPKLPFRGWGYPAASFYNAMIAPLIPFGIKGVLWYQGEARTERPLQYGAELNALITDWRGRWQQGDFPVLVVQLPRIIGDFSWPITREQQAQVARTVKNVGLVVTIDLPDTDLHPRIKEPIGQRLALAAQAIAYNMDVVHSGPVYDSMMVERNGIRLRFKPRGGDLVSSDGQPLQGFCIAGADRIFKPASAEIIGDDVLVSSPDVAEPVAVRYAFENNPACNLVNRAGLPAAPFRTDHWAIEVQR